MATRVPSAFLLIMCFVIAFASPLLADKSFDFYYFVLVWPGAYCIQSKCCRPTTGPPKNDFLVRGLWTYNSATGNPVTKCNSNSFHPDQLSSLEDDLHSYWANLKCPSNNGMAYWKKAWKTFGVCSGLNQTQYFKAALDLRARLDVLSLLANKSISPSLLYVYGVSEIESGIAEGIGGAKPVIRCSKGMLGLFQLYEIYICVAKDANTIIDCPVKPRFTCSQEILFPPFDNNNLPAPAAAAHIDE